PRSLGWSGKATERAAGCHLPNGRYRRARSARPYRRPAEALAIGQGGPMKAVVIRTPNRAFFRDEADPQAGEGEVLVKVALAGVCMSDVEVMKGRRPRPYV